MAGVISQDLTYKMSSRSEIAVMFEKIDTKFEGFITRERMIEYVTVSKLPATIVSVSHILASFSNKKNAMF